MRIDGDGHIFQEDFHPPRRTLRRRERVEGRPHLPRDRPQAGTGCRPLYCPSLILNCMKFTRIAFLAAPIVMLVYGVIRLFDGHRGPGVDWTAGHLAYLAAAILFAPVCLGLRRTAVTGVRRARSAPRLCSDCSPCRVALGSGPRSSCWPERSCRRSTST
jgi:hypothetical protein